MATTWNGVPEEVVNAKNTQTLKNALDKHWGNHLNKTIIYMCVCV